MPETETGIEEDILVSFESGHYKRIKGSWGGDSVWMHFVAKDGVHIHVNKEKVEYVQGKPIK